MELARSMHPSVKDLMAQINSFLHSPFSHRENLYHTVFIFLGFIPVTCIAMHVVHLVPLHLSSRLIALPSFSIVLWLGIKSNYGRLIIKGWLAGILAVLVYDVTRVPFMIAGWDDFIPKIGDWIFNEEDTHPLIGYAWRYIGNGGGMGIAFVFLSKSIGVVSKWTGMMYGLIIFSSLMCLLIFSDDGEIMMFRINLLTFSGSMIGHIIYGIILGSITDNQSLIKRH